MIIDLDPPPRRGDSIHATLRRAHEQAVLWCRQVAVMPNEDVEVQFQFNGIKCRVQDTSDLDSIYLDYRRAAQGGAGTVGPCSWAAIKSVADVVLDLLRRQRRDMTIFEITDALYRADISRITQVAAAVRELEQRGLIVRRVGLRHGEQAYKPL